MHHQFIPMTLDYSKVRNLKPHVSLWAQGTHSNSNKWLQLYQGLNYWVTSISIGKQLQLHVP